MKSTMIRTGFLAILTALPASAEMGSKFKIDMYGFIKTDFIYSDHGTSTNELRTYTTGGRNERSFRVSARSTRFGFDINNGAKVTGKIEADFNGLSDSIGGTAGTTADLRLRHAYAVLTAGKTEFLAGQTYYPITADLPETFNDYSMGNSGALWARAPQLRATYRPVDRLKFIAAVTRPTSKSTDAEGTHSALPGLQGKVEKELGKARVSLAGACAVWKSTSTQKSADVSALVAAFYVPYSIYTFYGEAWTGRNMSDFLGGLGNTGYGEKAVTSSGGFLALKIKPQSTFWFNAVYGEDDPDNSKVAVGGRTKNSTAFVNAVIHLDDCVDVGLETAALVTQYKGAAGLYNRSSMNYQFMFKFLF
ncbi:MAG: hypothetical protein WC204_09680 [Elusimicrobiales bacterium]